MGALRERGRRVSSQDDGPITVKVRGTGGGWMMVGSSNDERGKEISLVAVSLPLPFAAGGGQFPSLRNARGGERRRERAGD